MRKGLLKVRAMLHKALARQLLKDLESLDPTPIASQLTTGTSQLFLKVREERPFPRCISAMFCGFEYSIR